MSTLDRTHLRCRITGALRLGFPLSRRQLVSMLDTPYEAIKRATEEMEACGQITRKGQSRIARQGGAPTIHYALTKEPK